MTPREERVERACAAVFKQDAAKDAFRECAALLPTFSVFWNPDAGEQKAILEDGKGTIIEFFDIS